MGDAAKLGRRAGLAIVWLGLLYWAAVGVATVIPRVFFPPVATSTGSCPHQLRDLHTELLDQARGSLYSGHSMARFQEWSRRWDAHYEGLPVECRRRHQKPYALLGQLRHRVETRIRRQQRDLFPLMRRVERALGPSSGKPTESHP